MAEVSCWHEY